MTIFARKCTEFIVISCPFLLPRSLFPADGKDIKLMLDDSSAREDDGKTVCVIERGVRSYG
jgi:hypothetical protein